MRINETIKTVVGAFVIVAAALPTVCFAQTSTAESLYQAALPAYADTSCGPLDPGIASSGVFPECTWQKVTFLGKSERVPGLLFLPTTASAAKPVPCLILLHPLGGNKELMIPVARFFASIGYASWLIDDAGAGERQSTPGTSPVYTSLAALAAGTDSNIKESVVDLRRGIDYIQTRPEIDQTHIAALGVSLGAELAGILAGVDNRVCAVVLVSGGGNIGQIMVDEAKNDTAFGKMYPTLLANADPTALEQFFASDDPINFVAHISPRPLLMENGKLDNIIPPDTAQLLYDAAQQPKQIIWYPDAGHIPPPMEIYPAISAFLDKYLPTPGR